MILKIRKNFEKISERKIPIFWPSLQNEIDTKIREIQERDIE